MTKTNIQMLVEKANEQRKAAAEAQAINLINQIQAQHDWLKQVNGRLEQNTAYARKQNEEHAERNIQACREQLKNLLELTPIEANDILGRS